MGPHKPADLHALFASNLHHAEASEWAIVDSATPSKGECIPSGSPARSDSYSSVKEDLDGK
jgi:hypothetical protein